MTRYSIGMFVPLDWLTAIDLNLDLDLNSHNLYSYVRVVKSRKWRYIKSIQMYKWKERKERRTERMMMSVIAVECRERGSGAVCHVLCRGTRCNKVKSDFYLTAAVDLIWVQHAPILNSLLVSTIACCFTIRSDQILLGCFNRFSRDLSAMGMTGL